MYRDDLEALEARLRTLEAELEAERRTREAAQAETRAVRAAAAEAELAASRSCGFVTGRALGQRHWGGAMVLLLMAVTGAMMLSQLCSRDRCANRLGERLRRARVAAARCEQARITARLPSNMRTTMMSARAAYVAGEYRRAAGLASSVLIHDARNADALLVYAAAQCSLRDAKTARAALRRIENRRRRAVVRAVCKRHGVSLPAPPPRASKKPAAQKRVRSLTPPNGASRDPFVGIAPAAGATK